MSDSPDFSLNLTSAPRLAVLTGVLRLESAEAYERLFAPVRAEMLASTDRYTLDFTRVIFMNSSGIRVVGGLVLAARKAGIPLRIRGVSQSAWQRKTFASFRLLNGDLVLDLDET